jgi:hypothetical protein
VGTVHGVANQKAGELGLALPRGGSTPTQACLRAVLEQMERAIWATNFMATPAIPLEEVPFAFSCNQLSPPLASSCQAWKSKPSFEFATCQFLVRCFLLLLAVLESSHGLGTREAFCVLDWPAGGGQS